MLASTGAIAAPASERAFEPKLDRWRVLVYVGDTIEVRTRGGHDVATTVPEVEPLIRRVLGPVWSRQRGAQAIGIFAADFRDPRTTPYTWGGFLLTLCG
jgi:hypothetical protein